VKKEDEIRYYRTVLSDYSRRSFLRALVGGSGGNLSLRIPDTDTVLITPTGVALEEVYPDTSVLVDLDGNILESPRGHKGSKETGFHLSAYRIRPDVYAVVHVHPLYSTAFSCTGEDLPLATVPGRLNLKEVHCIPCYNPGSKELAEKVMDALKKYPDMKALLMRDHGILALGPDITTAYYNADLVEHTAKVAFLYQQIQSAKRQG
jgi:L-fuculose-phosphate aldolase